MRIPDGTATVCVEAAVQGESRSLGKLEKAAQSLGCVSQENCLNEVKTQGSASTGSVVFCCGKTAAAAHWWAAAAFCFDPLCAFPPIRTVCPGDHSPQTN